MPELNLMMPGNPRYQPPGLVLYFGYDKLYRWIAEVEVAVLKTLGEIGFIPPEDIALLTPEVEEKLRSITTTAVDEYERKITKHDVRAWIKCAKEIVDPRLGRWLHLLLTSYDVIDTGRILMFKRAHQEVVMPKIKELILIMSEWARKYAGVKKIGRTHLQHALPITVGFWMAGILSRVLDCFEEMARCADLLTGKISGAVGAKNAQVAFGIPELCGDVPFDKRVLAKLGLAPARISTQILPPERLARYLRAVADLTAALAQLGEDMRLLMSSDIGELIEVVDEQGSSSTMAGKVNPINAEGLCGAWDKTRGELAKLDSLKISDLERDLRGSSVARDLPIIVINLVSQLDILLRKKNDKSYLARVGVDEERCRENLEGARHSIVGEPLYIALQIGGLDDAHHFVNNTLAPKTRQLGVGLVDVLRERDPSDEALDRVVSRIPTQTIDLLNDPTTYIGDAPQQAREIADLAEATVGKY